MKSKAIIIGAGIAGPILAIQLKELGYDVEVFEARSQDNIHEGAFLGITPNGLNVLKQFFPLTMLKEDFTPGTMKFYNGKGKQIAELSTAYQKEKYGCETLQIKRGQLNNLIRNAAVAKSIKITYKKRCVHVEDLSDGVRAVFEDGQEEKGDILIACDGAFSMVRRIIFPKKAEPQFTKNISTGGYAHLPELSNPSDAIHMTFGERGFFAYSVSNHGEVWWFNNYYRETEPSKEEVQKFLKKEIEEHLLEIHKNDDPLFSKIIKSSDEVIAYPVYDIPKLEKWYNGRICLLGDAAHATSPHVGQGASLALEDTVVLSDCLKRNEITENAFENFQQLRQARVEKIIKQARKIGDNKSKPTPVATWFRDQFLGFFIKSEIKKLNWIYGYNAV